MEHSFTYAITDTENLIFAGDAHSFRIHSKPEGGSQELIASYRGGKWAFDNHQQRKLFLCLFDSNRAAFFKAFKAFQRSFKERPKLYEFTCIRRRFNIKVTRLKAGLWENLYNTFYTR